MKFGVILIKVEYILYILCKKRAIRICGNSDYRAHARPIFYQFKTLCIPDMVNFNSMMFMYKVFNNSLPNNLLVYFKEVYDCHQHNTRKNNVNFKIRFSTTSHKFVYEGSKKYGMNYAIV